MVLGEFAAAPPPCNCLTLPRRRTSFRCSRRASAALSYLWSWAFAAAVGVRVGKDPAFVARDDCADAIARYRRLKGDRVHFLMGNDEHSLKVEMAAREKGMTPLEHCDEMEAIFREVWAALDVDFDDFLERHPEEAYALFDA